MEESKKSFFSYLYKINIGLIFALVIILIYDLSFNLSALYEYKGYRSFFVQKNQLGIVLFITSLGTFAKIYDKGRIKHDIFITEKKNLFLLSLNLLFLILSHSRTSFMVTVIFILFNIFFIYRKVFVYLLLLLAIIFVGYLVSGFIKEQINFWIFYNSNSLFSNRLFLWEASWKAAKHHIFLGCGVGTSTPFVRLPDMVSGSKYFSGMYFREKGNGILALVEEIGSVGLLFFLFPFLYWGRSLIRIHNLLGAFSKTDIFLYISAIILLMIHLQFESWITSFNPFPILVLYIFLIQNLINIGKYKA